MINANSDPNGVAWYAGGVEPLTVEQQKIMDAIPELILPEYYKNRKTVLPYQIDNSNLSYFRPVFCQEGASCSQASGIGYVYTYEHNFVRKTSADVPVNQFPTHYTYNFLNNGSGENGSVVAQGWDIVQSGGCPDVAGYGGMLWPSDDPEKINKLWMTGYDKYEFSMSNGIIEQLSIPVGTPEGLGTLKQWFYDHCDGSEAGGLAVFSAGILDDIEIDKFPANSFCPNETVVLKWDKNVNHSMTLVGYNDSIRWDYNKDGKYTNDLDITGDGKVDMKDWEIGGVRMVNSWGTTWADGGKSWVMYRTLAQNYIDGGIFPNIAYTIRGRGSYQPKLKIKAEIDYSERNSICLIAGISNDISAHVPENTISFPYFNYQGGDSLGMSGDTDIIELGLDISPLLNYIKTGSQAKIFLCVEQRSGEGGTGRIEKFSVIDGMGTEYVCDQTGIEIIEGSITFASTIIPQTMRIETTYLPTVIPGNEYLHKLEAINGISPYTWETVTNYTEAQNINAYPTDTLQKLTMSDTDDGFAIINLPFAFPFYNKLYNTLTITTNGAITFNGLYENVKTLTDAYNTKTIAPCAADFELRKKDIVSYFANENYVVIKWKLTLKTSDTGSGSGSTTIPTCDFSAKLYSDGKIEFYYGTFSSWINRISAISNGTEESTKVSRISYEAAVSGVKTEFSIPPYPYGIELSSDGIFTGFLEPVNVTEWNILFKATDSNGLTYLQDLALSLADPSMTLSEPQKPIIFKNDISAVLSWDHVQGATIYHIYRSTDPYSGFVQIGTSTLPSYQDDEVLPGNKYFYYITSDNSY